MNLALRPYVTTGIAIVGASVIAVAPLTVPPPELPAVEVVAVDAVRSVTTDVELTAFVDALIAAFPEAAARIVEFVITTLPGAVVSEVAAGRFAHLLPIAVAVATGWHTVPLGAFIDAFEAGLPLPLGTFDGAVVQGYFLANWLTGLVPNLLTEVARVIDGVSAPGDLPANLIAVLTNTISGALNNFKNIIEAFAGAPPFGGLAAPAGVAAANAPLGIDPAADLAAFIQAVITVPGNLVTNIVNFVSAVPTYLEGVLTAPSPLEAIGTLALAFNNLHYSVTNPFLAPLTENFPQDPAEWDFIDAIRATIGSIASDAVGVVSTPADFVASVAFGSSPIAAAWNIARGYIFNPLDWTIPTVLALTNALPSPLGGVPDESATPEEQGLIFNTFLNAYLGLTNLLPPLPLQAQQMEVQADDPAGLDATNVNPQIAGDAGLLANSIAAPSGTTVTVTIDQAPGSFGTAAEPSTAPPAAEEPETPAETADLPAAQAPAATEPEPPELAKQESAESASATDKANGATDLTDGNKSEPDTTGTTADSQGSAGVNDNGEAATPTVQGAGDVAGQPTGNDSDANAGSNNSPSGGSSE